MFLSVITSWFGLNVILSLSLSTVPHISLLPSCPLLLHFRKVSSFPQLLCSCLSRTSRHWGKLLNLQICSLSTRGGWNRTHRLYYRFISKIKRHQCTVLFLPFISGQWLSALPHIFWVRTCRLWILSVLNFFPSGYVAILPQGALVSSHTPKTCRLSEMATPKCP